MPPHFHDLSDFTILQIQFIVQIINEIKFLFYASFLIRVEVERTLGNF